MERSTPLQIIRARLFRIAQVDALILVKHTIAVVDNCIDSIQTFFAALLIQFKQYKL